MAEAGLSERLLEQHLDGVYRYAFRLTQDADAAADLTQETMLRAWRRRASLRDAAAAKVWLLRIADNAWNDTLRRKLRLRRHEENTEQETADPRPSPTGGVEHQETLNRALAALDALPDRQRRVMHLAVCESLPQAEVAEVLGITTQAVKASLAAGRKRLREQLEDIDQQLQAKR